MGRSMTKNKKAKAAARAMKASANLPYTVARRRTPPPDGYDPDYSTPSLEALLKPHLQHVCDKLVEESIDSLGDIEVPGPLNVSKAAVHELQVHTSTIDVHIVEEFDNGSMVCSVFAEAALMAEGLMGKGEAAISVENGLVEIIDFDYDGLYALVAVTAAQAVEVEFDATVTLDAESVDDINFISASQLN